MSEKWTKGPWTAKMPKMITMTKRPSIEIDGRFSFVADFWGSCEEAKANAILASTAPELYNALDVLSKVCEDKGIPCDAAKAALAKARGEE